MSNVIEVSGLTKSFKKRRILDGLDFVLSQGETVAILGKTGAGKTTLLSILLGTLKPDAGQVRTLGHNPARMSASELAKLRRSSVGFVFQNGNLFPNLSAVENVALPALLAGTPKQVALSRAKQLLQDFNIPSPDEQLAVLSGGEQQRVAVARALVNDPRLIIGDEPTASLDEETRNTVLSLLLETASTRNISLLLVTHDKAVARQVSRTVTLVDGKFIN